MSSRRQKKQILWRYNPRKTYKSSISGGFICFEQTNSSSIYLAWNLEKPIARTNFWCKALTKDVLFLMYPENSCRFVNYTVKNRCTNWVSHSDKNQNLPIYFVSSDFLIPRTLSAWLIDSFITPTRGLESRISPDPCSVFGSLTESAFLSALSSRET